MRLRGRHSHRLGQLTALIALGLSLLLAATAGAEVRSGSAPDGTEPERVPGSVDIIAASASYDTAGSISVAVMTLAPPPVPTEAVVLGARFGVLSGNECVTPRAALIGTFTQPAAVAWGTTTGGEGTGTESIAGTTTTLTAAGAGLANQPYNCVEPAIYKVDAEGHLEEPAYEALTAPIPLVGPPPPVTTPPASTPPSNPAPAPTTPAPTSPPPPAPAPKVANLTFASPTITLHRNTWKKVKVKITNAGNAAAGSVALTVGKAKGVALKPKTGKLKLKSIAAGKSKTAAFKVRLTPQAKPSSKLKLTLSGAKGAKASGTLTVEAWKKPPPKTKGEKGKGEEPKPPAVPPLAEKIFYAYQTEPSHSATLIGYAFIDGEWAYHGVPAEGLPSCTSPGSDGTKASGEGCVKYTYDPATGEVKIGSATGKISSSGLLEIDGETYSATSVPPAGTRLQVEQEFVGYSGLCGLIVGCTTWHEHLILSSNGEFVLSSESLTTLGGNGPGETFVAAGSYPADQHGTYAVEKGARIKLSFADGSTKTKTFAYFLNKEGKPDPTYAGVLLGTEYFTFAHDE
jgi:hypothetical protein